MKSNSQSKAPVDADARRAIKPVICYPLDTLPLPNMALLAFTFAVNGDENIHRHAIDHDSTTSWVTGSGAAVLLPDPARIQPIVHAYLNFYD